MARKQSKAFQDLQNLQPTKIKGKFKIRRPKNSNLGNFVKEIKEKYPDIKIVKKGDGDFKISEILWAFVAPEKPLIKEDLEQGYFIMTIAVMAWNLSLLSEPVRQKEIENFLGTMNGENDLSLKNFVKEFLDIFLERKLEYFSEFDIFIADFKLQDFGDEIRLSVAYELR